MVYRFGEKWRTASGRLSLPFLLLVKGNRSRGEQREPQRSPSSSQSTTVEQEEGGKELLAINQQQREKGGNMTISPAVYCPLMRVNARLTLHLEDLAIYKLPVSAIGYL